MKIFLAVPGSVSWAVAIRLDLPLTESLSAAIRSAHRRPICTDMCWLVVTMTGRSVWSYGLGEGCVGGW